MSDILKQGPKGDRGPIGPRGWKGEKGDKGDKGDQGEMGLEGETGPEGPAGPQGPEGPMGLEGIQGKEGKQGPRGPRGPKGDRGEDGKDADAGEMEGIADQKLTEHEATFDHALIDPFLIGSKELDESAIGDKKVLAYDAKTGKLIYVEVKKGSDGKYVGGASYASLRNHPYTITNVSTTYTAAPSDGIIDADTTSAGFTITLPSAVGRDGRPYLFKIVAGSNVLTIATVNGETIDGATTKTITSLYGTLSIVSNGTNWDIMPVAGSGGGGTPGGSTTQVQFNDAGAFGGDTGLRWNKTIDQLKIGVSAVTEDLSSYPISIGGNVNSYFDGNIQNKSTGDSAQTDWVLSADNDSTGFAGHYTDIGITGSGWVGTSAALGIVKSVTVNAGGSGYIVGDVLTLVGGSNNCTVSVTTVSAGAVTSVTITFNGTNYSIASGLSTTGGTGTGCKLNVATLYDFTIYPANAGYVYISGGDLVLGTDDTIAGKVIKFHTGGQATANERMRITDTGLTVGLAGTLTGLVKFSGATSGTTSLTASSTGSGTLTLPAATDTLIGKATTDVLTNKQISPRIQSVADAGGTLTPSADANDLVIATALSQATTIAAPTPTANIVQGQKLMIRLKDNGTARALTWNAIYRASSDMALPTTTTVSKTMYLGFIYNSTDTKWDFVSFMNNF